MASNAASFDALRATVRAVCVPYPTITQEQIDNAVAVLIGEKSAVDPTKPTPVEPPMTCDEAARLLGISKTAVQYHARKGRIRRATIPGATRALGFVAADVRAILEGRAA